VPFDHVASGIVNADHRIVRYQARTYMEIRRRPSRQEMHRYVILMSEVVAQPGLKSNAHIDPWP
jgi:KaiC/GvpD/RAD55 family RecA-like ATPase